MAKFTQNDEVIIHEEFPYDYDQYTPPLEHGQCGGTHMYHYNDKWEIPDEFICYTEEKPKVWRLYFDDSKCTHREGVSIVLVSPTNDVIPMAYKLGFECTNNMAEYEVLLLGLREAALLKIKELKIYGDSKLVVNQVEDVYNTNDEKLKTYKEAVTDILNHFEKYIIENILRINNRYANAMESVASLMTIDIEDEEIILKIKNLDQPYCSYEVEEMEFYYVSQEGISLGWYGDVYNYLKDQVIPIFFDRNEKVRLKRTILKYFIIGDIL